VTAKKSDINLLTLKPMRTVEWEYAEDGLVVLKVLRFHSRFAARWILPHLRSPKVRVKLDFLGSFAWSLCDGETTVMSIVGRMHERFDGFSDPGYNRIARFLLGLEKDRSVSMREQQKERHDGNRD